MRVDVKSKTEIALMREACRMSAEIRDICANAVAPGMTTGDIDDIVAECQSQVDTWLAEQAEE